MFKKPFKIKSQIQLKSSEKRKFASDVRSLFPLLTDDDVTQLISIKENIIKTKIISHSEELVEIYVIDKIPMFFDIIDAKIKLPTIYMCWKFPHIVTKFTTNAVVLEKLKGGADLFLPGVFTDTAEFVDAIYHVGDAAAVNTHTNSAVLAVGQCLMSKGDVMSESSMLDGRLVKVYHAMGDFLSKSHPLPVPSMDPPLKAGEETKLEETEEPPLQNLTLSEQSQLDNVETEQGTNDSNNVVTSPSPEPMREELPPLSAAEERQQMDELLTYCFIKAVKMAPKNIYPILPAAFYANHILQAVPPGANLNIKKTKWKKLSGLLQEMSTEGVVKLETIRANEYKIVSGNTSHDRVRMFDDPHRIPVTVEATVTPHAQTSVQEVFVITAPTQPLFANSLQKGDEITRLDVRTFLTEYIKKEELVQPGAPDRVRLNPILTNIIKGNNVPDTMTRLDLLAGVLAAMPLRHKVSSAVGGDLIVHKANLPLVEYEVVKRSGNKKVTLISNVECYGVDVAAFAKSLQHSAAASTSVTGTVPGKKGPQVQVQGNQIHIAARLLSENHGIAEKYMRGLEKAPKLKKK